MTSEEPVEPPEQLLSIPTEGTSPLPFTESTEFLDGPLDAITNPKGSAATQSQSAPKANWDHLNPLLEAAVRQSGSRYAALFSVQDSSGNYHYSHNALEFPDAMVEEAGGDTRPYLFYLSQSKALTRLVLARIPDTDGAIQAFRNRLVPPKIDAADRFPSKEKGATQQATTVCISKITIADISASLNGRTSTGQRVYYDQYCFRAITIGGCSGGGFGWPGGSGGLPIPGGGGNGSSTAENFENRIIDSELAPCMKGELNTLTTIEQGVGSIVQDFAIDELNPGSLGNLNWEVKDGDLDPNKNGETSTNYNSATNTVTTTFDSGKFVKATDLSVARTILHEAVHAWMVSITFSNSLTTEERNDLLGDNWIHAFDNYGHNFIASDYVNRIADALQAFGNYRGYSLSRQFYEDMAWGGLFSTPEFANKSVQEQQRIRDTVHAEQYGTNTDGNYQAQKGDDAGC